MSKQSGRRPEKVPQFMVRLGKRHRRILARWVRQARRRGIKNPHEADAVREGIEFLDVWMKNNPV